MYKVFYIDRYNNIKLVEQLAQPAEHTVACFSGEETDLVPHVYLELDSEPAAETRHWAERNPTQQQFFKQYFQQK